MKFESFDDENWSSSKFKIGGGGGEGSVQWPQTFLGRVKSYGDSENIVRFVEAQSPSQMHKFSIYAFYLFLGQF